LILALLIALLAAADPGAPSVRARADLASYFRGVDYPPAAMVHGEQGNVAFLVSVAADGAVTGCRVTASSGSAALDAATCRILTERARFTPARNAAGAAVADEIAGRIGWVLPPSPTGARARANLAYYISDRDYPAESILYGEQGRVEFELDISTQGRVAACRVMRSATGPLLNLQTCRIMLQRARFTPARDAQGRAVIDTVAAAVTWVLP
jgi:TonB family protein